jgi:glycosyltransferase involved in cell wall biosynthesis
MRDASLMTTVSEGLSESISAAVGRSPQVIYNGFDHEAYTQPCGPLDAEFSITYTGSLIPGERDPQMLFAALDAMIRNKEVKLTDLRIRFIGTLEHLVRAAVAGSKVMESVEVYPWMSREKAISEQRKSQLLLMVSQPRSNGMLTSKLFEYLASGRPILSIPRDKAVSNIIEKFDAGVVCSSIAEVVEGLRHYYAQWRREGAVRPTAGMERVMCFSRRTQTHNLACSLDALIESRVPPGRNAMTPLTASSRF